MTRHDPLHGRHELATYYFHPRYAANGVVSDHSGRGNDLTPNGGVSTDATAGPTDFGAAELDGADDDYDAGVPLGVGGDTATALLARVDTWDNGEFDRLVDNFGTDDGFELSTASNTVGAFTAVAYDGSQNRVSVNANTELSTGEWFTAVHAIEDGQLQLYVDGSIRSAGSITGHTTGTKAGLRIGSTGSRNYLDGAVAYVGRFDLRRSASPSAAEIARRVDELTSVPRTRL